jgi:hypothetical protein
LSHGLPELDLLVACLIGIFVVWDLVFCGGRYCRRLFDRE